MNTKLIEALEVGLQVLDQGGTVEEYLARFPSLGGDLRPLLESAQAARSLSLPAIPDNAVTGGRVRVLNRAAQLRQGKRPLAQNLHAWRLAAIPLLVLALLFLTGNGLMAASANALPGDSLYPVKRSMEDIHLRLATDLKVEARIKREISARRINETEILLFEQRVEAVDFVGQVSEQLTHGWLIAAIPVRVTGETDVEGALAIAAKVEVRGQTQSDGFVLAKRVQVDPSVFGNDGDHPGSSRRSDKTPEPINTDDDSSEKGEGDGDKPPEPTKTDDHPSGSGHDRGHDHAVHDYSTPEPMFFNSRGDQVPVKRTPAGGCPPSEVPEPLGITRPVI